MKKIRCGITGANGFVGSKIADHLEKKGFEIVELGRSQKNKKRVFIPFSLGEEVDPTKLKHLDCIVHCAYDFSLKEWNAVKKINIEGTVKLFEAATKANVKKLIFISSLSSFEGCKSNYGRAKLAIEKLKQVHKVTIRPGLVFGKDAGGVIGALKKLTTLPILPVVGATKHQYLCHYEDLGNLVHIIIANNVEVTKPLVAASSTPHNFREIIKILAQKENKKPLILPIPYPLAYIGLRVLELLRLNKGLRSDSMIGLINNNPNVDFSETKKLDVQFREFTS